MSDFDQNDKPKDAAPGTSSNPAQQDAVRESPEPRDASVGAAGSLPTTSGSGELEGQVVEMLRTCFDPEIPVNIYDLGLIYSIQVDPAAAVSIRMTLTSPMCPVAGSLPPEVEAKVRNIPGVKDAKVEVVWDPPWGPGMMSEAARLQLNI